MAKAASHLEGVVTILVNQSNHVLPYHRVFRLSSVPEGHTLACIDTLAVSHKVLAQDVISHSPKNKSIKNS